MATGHIQKIIGGLKPQDSGDGSTVLVARQPIFDLAGKICAYELLFRDPAMKPGLGGKSSHAATSTVMSDGVELMRPSLRQGQRFFINFTAEMLEAELAGILPPDICVIEILETVEPTDSVLRGLNSLKSQGYMLALDDYIGQEQLRPFIDLADIVKVDVLGRDEASLLRLSSQLKKHPVTLLAEKVEDDAMAQMCRKLSFSMFQGFFFSRAEVVRGSKLSPSKSTKIRLLAMSTQEMDDLREMVAAISADVYLSFKLLKYVNSVYFGLAVQVRGIDHAIVLMGQNRLRQWLCVTALADMDAAPMSREMVYISALRAKFLELLAQRGGAAGGKNDAANLFLVGLFSMLETIMHVPMEEIFASLPIDGKIINALQQRSGPYFPWLALVEAYERGDWESARGLSAELKLSFRDLRAAYVEAATWSGILFGD